MTNILAKTILKEMQEEIKAAGNLTKDVEALELAIKALEGTALEVPVQEQLSNLEARQILENRFKVLAEECEPEFLDKTTDSMINIYTTLFPNQFFQE